ncbi:MAG TPA: Rid family detoxifying hydrolase [Clostridia bacterium]|nr:Rid family detoxifying hydrolase [Clostridia bacterium]
MRQVICTDKAPAAVGPYSQAVIYGNLLFLSGQVSMDPDSGEVLKGTVGEQTERVLKNIREVLAAGGSSMDSIIKCNVYLSHIDDFNEMNEMYRTFFSGEFPARLCVSKVDIFGGLAVEIDVIAGVD